MYDEYITDIKDQAYIQDKIDKGYMVKGKLNMNPKNKHLAYVDVEGFDEDVLIDGIRFHNRGAEGDIVLV